MTARHAFGGDVAAMRGELNGTFCASSTGLYIDEQRAKMKRSGGIGWIDL